MFTRAIIFTFFFFSASILRAQDDGSQLNGKVVDANTGEVLPYVTIIAQTLEAVFVDGTVSDSKGQYSIKLPKGKYVLNYSFIGYEKEEKSLDISREQVLDIAMTREAFTLETLVVNEERTSVEQKIDRKLINVGKDLQSGGGDALEVLNQLPEVQTNPDGGVELRGSGNVNILIDGKPSPLSPQDLLQQIDAAEIRQIELITSPSAKYRADGLSGIINIITQKKKKRGLSGSFNGSLSSNRQYRSGLQTAHGGKKTNLSMGLRFADTETRSKSDRSRISDTFNYRQRGNNLFDGRVKSLKTGMDWFINDKNEASFSANFTNSSHDIINNSQISEAFSDYRFEARNSHEHLTAEYNFNYRRTFSDKNHYLEADFHLSDNRNDLIANYDTGNDFWNSFINYKTQINNSSLDYVSPLKKWKALFESGLLYTTKRVNNRQEFEGDMAESAPNRFNFDENSIGVYAMFKKDWKKLQTQLGLRYEGFWSESAFEANNQKTKQNFHNLFPSLHLSYPLNETSRVNFGYNRRISRPNLWHVNPYANASNRFFNRRGNPGLQAEFSHNFEWNFSSSRPFWSFNPGLFYRYKTNLILPFYQSDEENNVWQSFFNEGHSHAYGAEFSLSIFPLKFLRTNINGNVYWEQIGGSSGDKIGFIHLNRHNWTVKNLFKVHKNVDFDMTWVYRGGGKYRYSESLKSGKMDMAIRLKILAGKGSLNLRYTDVFDTYQSQSFLFGEDFEERSFRKWQTSVIYLSFSYQFANGTDVQKRRRKNRRFSEPGATE